MVDVLTICLWFNEIVHQNALYTSVLLTAFKYTFAFINEIYTDMKWGIVLCAEILKIVISVSSTMKRTGLQCPTISLF